MPIMQHSGNHPETRSRYIGIRQSEYALPNKYILEYILPAIYVSISASRQPIRLSHSLPLAWRERRKRDGTRAGSVHDMRWETLPAIGIACYISSRYTAPYPAASSSLMPSFSISSAGMKSEIIIGGFVASAVSAICASSGDM